MNKKGIDLIVDERFRHEDLGYNIEHDMLTNNRRQLARLARKLLIPDTSGIMEFPPTGYPLKKWQAMARKPYRERLIIAGSLIAAEIDRVDANS